MIAMTLAQVAAATGGQLADATGAETVLGRATVDSRAITLGALFVAVPGEHADGHDFAAGAFAGGAGGVLGTRATGVPSVLIDPGSDAATAVVAALGRLARTTLDGARSVRVTAVTGSSGKTSTKDLLAQVLAAAGPTVAPPGSYNNDLGLPLTVLDIDETTRHLVLEMGARAVGDIARLCQIAPPQTGVVLNVGLAHVGEFGSREQTAIAKGELVEALPSDGLAVLNADDPLVAAMASRTSARVLRFGYGSDADVRAERVSLGDDGRPRFRLWTPDGSAEVGLQLVGAHQVANSLAAAAAGLAAGLDIDQITGRLSTATALSRWRMEVHTRADGVTVINDAYNANPDSMRAGLSALTSLARGSRTWAVLGEMLELGPASASEHAEIGRLTVELGITRVVAVGAGAGDVHEGASAARAADSARHGSSPHGVSRQEASVLVPDVDAALALLGDELRAGDVVLVKSSNGAGLRFLGDALVADQPPADPTTPGPSA